MTWLRAKEGRQVTRKPFCYGLPPTKGLVSEAAKVLQLCSLVAVLAGLEWALQVR